MEVLSKTESAILLAYGAESAKLELKLGIYPNNIDWMHIFSICVCSTTFFFSTVSSIDRKQAYGRIAFAVPYDQQPAIEKIITENKQQILTPLITLPTPGKADVRVIILADPDNHEICFVDEEGFSQLSQVEPNGDADLTKYIKSDPFQTK